MVLILIIMNLTKYLINILKNMKYKNNNPEKRIFYKEDELIIEKITQNIGILENKYKIKIDILYNSQSINFFAI